MGNRETESYYINIFKAHHKGGINVCALCHDSLICFLRYFTKRIKVDNSLVDLKLKQVHSLRIINGCAESAQYLSDNCLDPLSTKSLTKCPTNFQKNVLKALPRLFIGLMDM